MLENRDELVSEYTEYAHRIVGKLIKSFGLPKSNYEEYISSALLGLVEASKRFNPEVGVSFKSYAFFRIRGAVIDYIRSNSDLSGRAYRYSKVLDSMSELRIAESSKYNTSYETDTLKWMNNYISQGALAFRLSLIEAESEVINKESNSDIESSFQQKEILAILWKIVEKLPEKQKIVIKEYYQNGMTFTAIANKYPGMSKSWISRLHRRAMLSIKEEYFKNEN